MKMKSLIIMIFAFLLIGCKSTSPKEEVTESGKDSIIYVDRIVQIKDTLSIKKMDSISIVIYKQQSQIDSLKYVNNKLAKELLHNKHILENARYYLNIANNKSSQRKFLRGWMNRALNQ